MKTSPFFAQPVVRCRVAWGYISAWSKPLRGGKVVVDVGAEDFSGHDFSGLSTMLRSLPSIANCARTFSPNPADAISALRKTATISSIVNVINETTPRRVKNIENAPM